MSSEEKNKPKYSVVICTYNRAASLCRALQSMAAQQFDASRFEVVIVDNNSSDDTEEQVADFIQNNPGLQVRYFKESNAGVSYARNRGVRESQGEYIVFLDDDETVWNDFLSHLDAFFKAYPHALLCAEPVVPLYEGTPPHWLSPYTEAMLTGAYHKGEHVKYLKTSDYPGTGHATFKRELFFKYGDFNTGLGRKGSSLLGGEDKDFFLRLINNGVTCYYVPEATIFHHIPSHKLTDEFFDKLTFSIGQSERLRTKNISRPAYYKRIASEVIKWGGTLTLSVYYLMQGQSHKGHKLIQFRANVTKGLMTRGG